MSLHRLIVRVVTDWKLWRARRRVHRTCPEIAAIPPKARDHAGRFTSTALARRKAVTERLKKELAA